jgi:SET domain-containing protein 6
LAIVLKAFKRWRPDAFLGKRQRDDICSSVIKQALTMKLAQYSTSIQEDGRLLKTEEISKRHRMAIEVRLGEKMLLQEAIALMQEVSSASEDKNGEPASKKAKTCT